MKEPWSLYVHIPFCKTRCSYCDFVTSAEAGDRIPRYLRALEREIEFTARSLVPRDPVHSVYFGGGTPSILTQDQIESVLNTIRANFRLSGSPEITLEANPGDLGADQAERLNEIGVNRLSLGVQSGHDGELRRMGRRHTVADTVQAVSAARAAGFKNISFDLIFGYPGQSQKDWRESLEFALSLAPDHLSLYALSIEDGTALERAVAAGNAVALSGDELADRYEFALDFLRDAGWNHYEISNWSRTAESESRHNKQYWRQGPYLGFGVAAHGYAYHSRSANIADLDAYLNAVNGCDARFFPPFPAAAETSMQPSQEEMRDEMIFGLRMLHEGVDLARFEKRHGIKAESHFHSFIEKHSAGGRVTLSADRKLRLNPRYAFISNQIFIDLV